MALQEEEQVVEEEAAAAGGIEDRNLWGLYE